MKKGLMKKSVHHVAKGQSCPNFDKAKSMMMGGAKGGKKMGKY